ncbi:hypothetical protein PFISCL1PPCAC_11908, partial [Pristionchus fissidentatus]
DDISTMNNDEVVNATRDEIFSFFIGNAMNDDMDSEMRFFRLLYKLYTDEPLEARITSKNISESEKELVKRWFDAPLGFHCSLCCEAELPAFCEDSIFTREILSGIILYRLEFFPLFVDILDRSKDEIRWLLSHFRCSEFAFYNVIETQYVVEEFDSAAGPKDHSFWNSDFVAPEHCDHGDSEYALSD